VNRRLAETCEKNPELVPFGSVNPTLPGWKNDLRACADEFGMRGIRLHPNYHGYSLDESRFGDLLAHAAEADLLVQIVATMEDTRTQNANAAVPDVDLSLLPAVVERLPESRIQILNWRPRGAVLDAMGDLPGVVFDTARIDGTDGIEQLQQVVSADRVLFGSHAPFLIPEAALIRVIHESKFDESRLRQIVQSNAEREVAKNR
jgi:predicted TIM-barrel fold metal-dependent hydrolase